MPNLIPIEQIANKIYVIGGKKVMLDSDLAQLYGVETGQLKRQVNRNRERFPEDFMFQFTEKEFSDLRCQFGTSSWGGRRYAPYAFTELGVAMLSSILNSKRAIQINIQIMRAFTKLREYLESHRALARKVEEHDKNIKLIFSTLHQLMNPPEAKKIEIKKIPGFRP